MKQLCILIIVCSIGTSIHAQIRWGVKAGANMSKYTGDALNITDPTGRPIETLNYDYAYGFNAGGIMNYEFNRSFSIQPEILFTLIQSALKIDSENLRYLEIDPENLRHQNYYLQLPANLKFSSYFSNNNSLQIFAGPYIGYQLSDESYANGKKTEVNLFPEMKNKKFDYGITIGIGYEIKRKYAVNASYQLGLQKINPDENNKWRSFQLSLCYFI